MSTEWTPASTLRRRALASTLGFETTADLTPLEDVLGQDRAVRAIQLGVGMRRKGYNVFAIGPTGSGRHTVVRDYLEARAANEPVPPDFVYVNDFDDARRPKAIGLPAGRGRVLEHDMKKLVDDLKAALPAAFESDEYRARREALEQEIQARQKRAAGALEGLAEELSIGIAHTPAGFAVAPLRDGEILSMEALDKLPDEDKQRIKKNIERIEQHIHAMLAEIPKWQKEHRDAVRALDRETTRDAVGHLIEALRATWSDQPAVLAYFDAVDADVVEHAIDLLRPTEASEAAALLGQAAADHEPLALRRYRVNVMVDHTETKGAPVISEDHPTVPDLIGRIEQVSRLGTLTTDFTLIEAGALHRANGGYLLLDARKVLMQPYAWEELKRALRAGEIRTRGLGELAGLISTVSLEPSPIPLDVKVVLVGERELFYLLGRYDPELGEHFKVLADFEDEMERDDAGERLFARLLARLAREKELVPFHVEAVARVIEESSRWVGDSAKLSTNIRRLGDLLVEADHWAREEKHARVERSDVERALHEQIERLDRPRDRLEEAVQKGLVLIETSGARVGQVNALAAIDLGELRFGLPRRVSARVRMGRGEVVDIEREVELGGPIHSKGVMILTGFLGGRFGRTKPLAFAASLVFEQSYGGIEGDSASMAELCALLSALADVPLSQSIAITGSVDQHGRAQAVGAVDEKIEGFFDACVERGLTGDQGVIVPASNVTRLMLRSDVVTAVAEGRFHVWSVETVDDAMALLTDLPAGEPDRAGRFPDGSLNALVDTRLETLAEAVKRFAGGKSD
jgi:predicted ATP-dependent protease